MANQNGLDFGDYLAAAVVSVIAGVSGAMAWFNNSRQHIYDRLITVETNMKEWDKLNAAHNVQLERVKTCQENTARQLELIQQSTRDTNRGLAELSETVTKVLLAIQAKD